MNTFAGKEMLNTLKSIDVTLKRIEHNLNVDESKKGKKTPAHYSGEYMKNAIAGAIHDISQ